MKVKYKNLINDTLIFAIGSIGSKCILFFLVPLYTNYLSAEEYGIADLVFTMAQLIVPFVSVVIFDAVTRFGLSKSERAEDVLLVSFIVWAAGSVVTVCLTPVLNYYRPISEWKWYLCIYVIFYIVCIIEQNYLKVKENNRLYAIVSIVQTAILALLNVVFLTVCDFGIKGYLLANIIATLSISVFLFCGSGVGRDLKQAKFNPELMQKMLLFSAPLILNNISWWLIHSTDKIMIEMMLGSVALGLYTVATKIPALINVMISVFSQAWGISTIREIESTNDKEFYSNVFKWYSIIAFGACIGLNALIKPFMQLYVGATFQTAWRYVPILLVSAVFSAIASYFGAMYGAMKKPINNMLTTLSAAIVNVVVNYVCILRLGIWGALIGTVVSYAVLSIARMMDCRRYVSIPIHWKSYTVSWILVVTQAVLVSLEWHIYTVSAIIIALFVGLNCKDLRALLSQIRK